MFSGFLIMDKPAGMTSHDVVSRLRRILKTKKIGHTGTLDPFATGVLVMPVGKATRLARFLNQDEKEYEATIQFGSETDTGDRTGKVKGKRQKVKIEVSEIESVLETFRGEIEQIPPMFSAKKVKGKKLYELAREGIEIEREPVKVTIYKLELIEANENLEFEKEKIRNPQSTIRIQVACSAGTYIRTLAEDIGKKVGVGAHLAELRRTRAGNFDLSKASTLEELEKIVDENNLSKVAVSMSDALAHLPKVSLNNEELKKIQNGIKLEFEDEQITDEAAIRLIDEENNLAAIGFYRATDRFIQPKVVLL